MMCRVDQLVSFFPSSFWFRCPMKTSSLLVVLPLAAALAACGKGDPAVAPAPPADSTEQAVAAPAAEEVLPASDFVADTGEAPAPGGGCSLEAVNGAPVGDSAAVAGEAIIEGWAVPSDPADNGDAMLVLSGAENRYATSLTRSFDRPDVSASLQREDALTSGFKQRTSLAAVAAGEYVVHVRIGGVECDTGRKLVVGAG